MAQIAILGFGTVGSGVDKVLRENADVIKQRAGEDVTVKYVLDLRDFPDDPVRDKLVHDYNIILEDPDISVIAEVMGGVEPAYTFVKQALKAGKSAVTSNKELVAVHGAELLRTARDNGVNFLFEASVGGGIPVLRPLSQAVLADKIMEISGILNGTTNYMLTRMDAEGIDYDDVLKQAQEMGYAERHPEADVEGYDACRKIAILTSLACGRQVDYEDIHTEGITDITETDFAYAADLGGSIKLLGTSLMDEEGISCKVSPVFIRKDNPLYPVRDVFNAVLVRGNMLGDIMFYGKGAGKEPTASAVVSDIVTAVRYADRTLTINWEPEKLTLKPFERFKSRFLIRVKGDAGECPEQIYSLFGKTDILKPESVSGEYGFVTGQMTVSELDEKVRQLPGYIKRIFVSE